ncbi:MAG: lipid-A-disaccharide synthase, partial [Paramuribaculum sp.]|nr:lipid-A-disaccharide synthase [Paramuribaculum sp.]
DYFDRIGVDSTKPVVALLPGSRIGEIRANLPVMLRALPEGCSAVIAAAPAVPDSLYRELGSGEIPLLVGDSVQLMRLSTVAAVTSGTATLECALTGTPQVVGYRANGSKLSYSVMRRLLHVDFVSLPNLIVGRSIIPELLLHNCTSEWVRAELLSLIPADSQARLDQLDGYREMRRRLGDSPAALTAARDILAALAR